MVVHFHSSRSAMPRASVASASSSSRNAELWSCTACSAPTRGLFGPEVEQPERMDGGAARHLGLRGLDPGVDPPDPLIGRPAELLVIEQVEVLVGVAQPGVVETGPSAGRSCPARRSRGRSRRGRRPGCTGRPSRRRRGAPRGCGRWPGRRSISAWKPYLASVVTASGAMAAPHSRSGTCLIR